MYYSIASSHIVINVAYTSVPILIMAAFELFVKICIAVNDNLIIA